MHAIPCSFVYANGRACTGRITRIATFKADVKWRESADGTWQFGWSDRTHYHVFCSERDSHARYNQRDDERMKFFYRDLPDEVRAVIDGTGLKGNSLSS